MGVYTPVKLSSVPSNDTCQVINTIKRDRTSPFDGFVDLEFHSRFMSSFSGKALKSYITSISTRLLRFNFLLSIFAKLQHLHVATQHIRSKLPIALTFTFLQTRIYNSPLHLSLDHLRLPDITSRLGIHSPSRASQQAKSIIISSPSKTTNIYNQVAHAFTT